MKIRVGILDQDQIYVSRLIQYFTTYYIDKLEISAFGDVDKFLEFLQHTKIDIFLADPDLVPANIDLPKTIIMAYLSEAAQAESVNNVKVVFKYQRAEMIYREILGLYAELDRKTAYKEAEGVSPIYFFMGASGGTGTTTLAIACAERLASYGKKVLYLNLEENGVISPLLQGEGNATMSDVLYAVKSGHSNLILKLESMVRKSEQGVYFYEPFPITLDAHEMTESNLSEILNALTLYFSYDNIIIDADAVILWKRDLLIKYAKHIFVVDDGTQISNQKLEKLLHELTIKDENEEERTMSKVRVLYNRFTDACRKADTSYQEAVYGTVKAFENSSPSYVAGKLSQSPFFDKLV